MSELNGVIAIKERFEDDPMNMTVEDVEKIIQSYRDATTVAAGLFDSDNIGYDEGSRELDYATLEDKKTLGEYHRGAVELVIYMHGLNGDYYEDVVSDIASKMNFR